MSPYSYFSLNCLTDHRTADNKGVETGIRTRKSMHKVRRCAEAGSAVALSRGIIVKLLLCLKIIHKNHYYSYANSPESNMSVAAFPDS